MLFFVSPSGGVLVTSSRILSQKTTLSVPLLDTNLRFLVLNSRFEPRPAMQLQGTVGGTSFLRVMGEDPPVLTLNGLITGSTNCDQLRLIESAFKTGVDLFVENSVVQNLIPITYTLGAGSTVRDAFLVGLTLTAAESFSDIIQFAMTLISEPVVKIQSPTVFAGQVVGAAANVAAIPQAPADFLSKGLKLNTTLPSSYVTGLSRRSLTFRPVTANVAVVQSPLGTGVRSSSGILLSAGSRRGIVSQTAIA